MCAHLCHLDALFMPRLSEVWEIATDRHEMPRSEASRNLLYHQCSGEVPRFAYPPPSQLMNKN